MKENSIKTIKIFLASSEELADERVKFGDFIRQLDDTYEMRGYRIKLIKWEDLLSGDNGRPKQDEYNDKVRECDMFVGLFHTKAGPFTLEEYDTAKSSQQDIGKPSVFVFCRELLDGEQEEPSLKEFKSKLLEDIHHYWNKYSNSDSLQLQFVMQLLKLENARWDELKVENGNVLLGNMEIAKMDNLQFATVNPDYRRMNERLTELSVLIEKTRLRIKKYPDDEGFKEELQNLFEEQNRLQEDFNKSQKLLIDTAMRITKLRGEIITDRMSQAIEAFENGSVREANRILEKAEEDAERNYTDFMQSKSVTEQKRQNCINSIQELLLQIATTMSDDSMSIEERIKQTVNKYSRVDKIAQGVEYDKKQYRDLLTGYAESLDKYDLIHEAVGVYHRAISLETELNGDDSEICDRLYNRLGLLYLRLGDYHNAIVFLKKALALSIKYYGDNSQTAAIDYQNVGDVYFEVENVSEASEYYKKALAIEEKWLVKEKRKHGAKSTQVADVYLRMGSLVFKIEELYANVSIKYLQKSLSIYKNVPGANKEVAFLYKFMGDIYVSSCFLYEGKEREKRISISFDLQDKALTIFKGLYGDKHSAIANVYQSIGRILADRADFDNALAYFNSSIEIYKCVYGTELHVDIAKIYKEIGRIFRYEKKDYQNGADYYKKALDIFKRIYGTEEKYSIVDLYQRIGDCYCNNDFTLAAKYYKKSIEIDESAGIMESCLGNRWLAYKYQTIGLEFELSGDNDYALECYFKALNCGKKLENDDFEWFIANITLDIGAVYESLGDCSHALEYYEKSLSVLEKEDSPKVSEKIVDVQRRIDEIKGKMKHYA